MSESLSTVRTNCKVAKVDSTLGLVLGWAIISKLDNEPYFDLQGDHIPEDLMLKASTDFMENSRTAKAMHAGEQRGSILFAFPMTEEIAKAFEIDTGGKYGLMVAMKADEDMLARFASGEYTGFSIGGKGSSEEVTDDEA
jgi:hypothetical protein